MTIKSTLIALLCLLCQYYQAYAVLPPGYEDLMYCPPGYCDRFVSHGNSGFVGPASSFHECFNPETGEVMDEVWTGSLSEVVAPKGWIESPPACESQQSQMSDSTTCQDNLNFKVGRRTCASVLKVPKSCKSSKSMRHKLFCTDEEVALNCPRSCGLCVFEESTNTNTNTNTTSTNDDDADDDNDDTANGNDNNGIITAIPENTNCDFFNANQLTQAVQAIQKNETNFHQVSCTPGSNYKSIVYQLHGGDKRFPYRYGVEGRSEYLAAQCFQFDMHSLVNESIYMACKELMDSACQLLSQEEIL